MPEQKSELTLGYTTIGDLLLEGRLTCCAGNDRNAKPQGLQNVALNIPAYQRPYKWKAKHAAQLLDDIVQAWLSKKETYRLGTLILYREKSGTPSRFDIVDGQQRLITLSLLLHVMHGVLSKKGKGEANGEDGIPFLDNAPFENPYTKHNIQKNHATLKHRIEHFEESGLPDFYGYIKERCELLVVITEDISEAFQFFDSQNARGKELYPHDLLKAYHLREMQDADAEATEKTVQTWENMEQQKLADLFGEYIYRVKEWLHGNLPTQLASTNVDMFKGLSRADRSPYASFYKGAYAYAEQVNNSRIAFVAGGHRLRPFQLESPIIAGKAFFEYAKYYFEILKDIQDNSKYAGHFISGNPIVETLDKHYDKGTGNAIARLLFDTAILLYVDRFCADTPSKESLELLEQFVIYAFVWAYSLRAQRERLGWKSAHKYVLGGYDNSLINALNIYKEIACAVSPASLFSTLSEKLNPIVKQNIDAGKLAEDKSDYLHWFMHYNFLAGEKQ